MANLPISGLAPGAAISDSDLFPDVQTVGVGPVKVTGAQIKSYTSNSPTLSSATLTGTTTFSSFTTGSVLFIGAAGSVAQDNSNLFWDDTNIRLGIGTSSPQSSLVVSNSGAESQELSAGSVSGQTQILSYNRSTSAYITQAYNASNYLWKTSNTSIAALSSAGFLGLGGITSPSAMLSLNATSTSTSQIAGYQSATYFYGFGRSGNGLNIDSYDFISFSTGSTTGVRTGATKLTINAGTSGNIYTSGTGNFGILQSSPSYTLDVNGTFRVVNAAYLNSTVNNVTITSPVATATLTLASGSTFATSGSYAATLTFTAATSLTFPTSGTVTALGNSTTGSGNIVLATSPSLTTPSIGVASGTSLAVTAAVSSSGTAGIGYATGAGGTVTQATSRTTGVTLSKISGAITLFSTTTTAGQVTTFTVTNTLVAATDVVVASVKTATGIYFVNVTTVAAGSFALSVYTPAAVAVAEAPVINFAVIKAVAA